MASNIITTAGKGKFTFDEYCKIGTTKLSREVLPSGTRVATLEGEYTCAEPSRLAVDASGNVYPVAQSVFEKSYRPGAGAADGALEFLKRCGDSYRIVSSGDLTTHQQAEAQSRGLFFVDPNGFGYALLPWGLTTAKDRKREADYFSRNNMMV